MKFTAYLSLGSNTGDRLYYLMNARDKISSFARIEKKSAIYITEAWGEKDQPEFLNQVLEIQTELTPIQLLLRLQAIEKELGKKQRYRWGPREIDIDILFYGSLIIKEADLQIPHKQIQNRKFILQPMAEIAANYTHPELKRRISDLLEECKDPLKVKLL